MEDEDEKHFLEAEAPYPHLPGDESSRQSSLSVDSEEVRVLGAPISDRSEEEDEEEERLLKPKVLVDEEGKNVDKEEGRGVEEVERKEEDSLRDFEEQEREVARQLASGEIGEDGPEEEEDGRGGEEAEEEGELMEQIKEEEEDEEEQEEEEGTKDNDEYDDEAKEKEEEEEEGIYEMEGNSWRQTEAEELPRASQSRVSESLQNREFTGSEILRDNLQQRLDSAGSKNSEGYRLDYPRDPPPAYTSPRTISRGRLFVGERPNTSSSSSIGHKVMEAGGRGGGIVPEDGGYAVPSPRFIGPKNGEEDEEGNGQRSEADEEEEAARSTANLRAAIGGSFALAGGMAAAVVGTAASRDKRQQQPPTMMAPVGQSPRRFAESPRPMLVQGARTAADLGRKEQQQQQQRPESARSSAGKERDSIDSGRQQQQQQQQQRYPASAEMKALFGQIEDYVAERDEIDALLRPFQIDYIPAVGDVDPFIKVPRPDESDDLQLGLAVLDEPAAAQSDPAIVDLRLHQMAGKSGSADAPVKKLSRADRNSHQIDRWVQSVRELRRTKPPDRVNYSKPMPSIEALMQEWPNGVEQNLKGMKLLLNANLDAALEDFVDLCLALVDIPVHKNRLEALHLFFSLYAEFRNSQHFRNLALGHGGEEERGGTAQTTVDNFILDEGGGGGGIGIGTTTAEMEQQQRNRLEIDGTF